MFRGLAYKRSVRRKHINRKSRIVRAVWIDGCKCLEDERFVGGLNKGKVHCSCRMCSSKTSRDGYKARDRREIQRYKDYKEYLD